jgi:hypothetical protein
MAEMTPGAVLRELQQAQAAMRKARQALRLARTGEADAQVVLRAGWEGLTRAHRTLAAIPLASASDEVMTRQIAVGRYATALLVRLRRLARNGPEALDDLDEELEGDVD